MDNLEKSKKVFEQIMIKYNSNNADLVEDAKLEAVQYMEKLMYSIIKVHFFEYAPDYTVELLQEGAVGVLIGLKNYNPDIAAPSTHFYWFIKHEMQSFIDSVVLGVSEYYSTNIKKIKLAIKHINDYNIEYTEETIAKFSKLPIKTVKQTLDMIYYNKKISFEDLQNIIENNNSYSNYKSAEDVFINNTSKEIINKTISETLSPKEEFVVRNFLGLNTSNIHLKNKDIAKVLNLSTNQTRYIFNTAIKKLRNSELMSFYD